MKRFNFGSAILASILATIVMTAFMMYFGMDVMQSLGMMAGMTGSMVYVVGGFIHFVVGIVYGLIYALFFKPWMQRVPGFLSGALYSLFPFILAITMMGQFQAIIKSIFHSEAMMMSQACIPACEPATNNCEMKCPPAPAASPAPTAPAKVPAKSPSPQTRPCAACAPCMPEEGCQAETPCNTSPTAYTSKKAKPVASVKKSKMRTFGKKVKEEPVAKDTYSKVTAMSAKDIDSFFALVGQGCTPCHPKMTPSKPMSSGTHEGIFEEEVKEGKERKEKLGFPSALWTFFNHLVYGFFLGLFYRQRRM